MVYLWKKVKVDICTAYRFHELHYTEHANCISHFLLYERCEHTKQILFHMAGWSVSTTPLSNPFQAP